MPPVAGGGARARESRVRVLLKGFLSWGRRKWCGKYDGIIQVALNVLSVK